MANNKTLIRTQRIYNNCLYVPKPYLKALGIKNGDKIVLCLSQDKKSLVLSPEPSLLGTLDNYFENFPEEVKALFLSQKKQKSKF